VDGTQTYPADAGADIFLLTVLGTPNVTATAGARDLHNSTAGAPPRAAGARALGDLSHNVFVPAESDELRLLFIDTWNSPSGIGQFFGNPQVAEAAGALFAERTARLWAPAPGYGSYALPTPTGRSIAGVGYLRAPVSSLEAAQKAFRAHADARINSSRLVGQIAHQVWLPVPMDGSPAPLEVLGLDYWQDVDAMIAFYSAGDFSHLAPAFTGAPESGTWQAAGRDWVEW
jgi:hypothetical protein